MRRSSESALGCALLLLAFFMGLVVGCTAMLLIRDL